MSEQRPANTMNQEHAALVAILEARIRHCDNQLAQARVSIESWKEKYERDLKEQRRIFDKFLALCGAADDYKKWYSENVA